jgi:hypothetical protein
MRLPLSRAEVEQMKTLKGLAIQDIVTEIHLFTHRYAWSSLFLSLLMAQC